MKKRKKIKVGLFNKRNVLKKKKENYAFSDIQSKQVQTRQFSIQFSCFQNIYLYVF